MKSGKRKERVSYVSLSALVLATLYSAPAKGQSITCLQPILFGTLSVSCPAAATVTIRPDGTRSITGCLIGGGPYSNGSCNVSQNFPFQSIKISVPAGAQITRTNGPQTMPLNNFNIVTNANGPTFTTSGPFINVPVGGQLNPGASPVSGVYEGAFAVTAIFQ